MYSYQDIGIDWSVVPPDQLERAKSLDRRISDFETGLYADYGNNLSGINAQLQVVLMGQKTVEEILPKVVNVYRYMESVYRDIKLDQIPLNPDTACYYVCQGLYPNLKSAFERLIDEARGKSDVARAINEVIYWARALIDIGRGPYAIIKMNVLTELQSIPGCEARDLNRKRPKISE